MKRITVDNVMSWGPCQAYPRDRVNDLFRFRKWMSPRTVSKLDIPESDKLWVLFRGEVTPRDVMVRFMGDATQRILLRERECGREPDERLWRAADAQIARLESRISPEDWLKAFNDVDEAESEAHAAVIGITEKRHFHAALARACACKVLRSSLKENTWADLAIVVVLGYMIDYAGNEGAAFGLLNAGEPGTYDEQEIIEDAMDFARDIEKDWQFKHFCELMGWEQQLNGGKK